MQNMDVTMGFAGRKHSHWIEYDELWRDISEPQAMQKFLQLRWPHKNILVCNTKYTHGYICFSLLLTYHQI